VLASLNDELTNLGKTAQQLRIEKELRAANVDAATDEGKAIAAKVHEIFAEQQAQKDAAAASREAASASRQSREQTAREVERQHETVERLIESLKEEVEIEKTSDPVQQELIRLRGQMAGATDEERAKIEELIRTKIALQNAEKQDKSLYGASIDYLKDFVEKAGTAADLIKEAISGAFSSAADAVAEFVRTGKVNFASLISSMLADLARLAVQQGVLAPLAKLLGGLLGGGGGIGSLIGGLIGSASGNVFDQGRLLQFAGGGVVTSPTLFPMRGGLGLMGEAGPEAIVPLARAGRQAWGARRRLQHHRQHQHARH
jgi:lambda family phage tail tape measure protein